MKQTINNNYELYTSIVGGTSSIILDATASNTNSNIIIRSTGLIEQKVNNAKKYIGAETGSIEFCGSTETIKEMDIPAYSSIMLKCAFNVYKNTGSFGSQSYSVEKVINLVRGASGNATQIGSVAQTFSMSNFSGVDGTLVINGTKASIRLLTPAGYTFINYQINYEYIILTNTNTDEPFFG